jgi:hypothetical protein
MLDGGLCVASIRIQPAAAFPAPDKGWIEFQNTGDEASSMIQLTGHCVDRASGSQNDRIIGVKDTSALAE